MRELKGKVAAVTGAASGIGRHTAVLLAREGCRLAISDIDADGLGQTAEAIRALGGEVRETVLDVSDRDAVFAWAREVAGGFGKVNIVVNNAGAALSARVTDMTAEELRWLMDINFYGAVHGTQAFLPYLRKADGGHVVNLSSIFGISFQPLNSAYGSSKAAIAAFTECLRMELDVERCGVSATAVHPGGIKTNIARNARLNPATARELETDIEEMAAQFDDIARTTPEEAARRIVTGIRRNRRRVLVGGDARLLDIARRAAPSLSQFLIGALYSLQRLTSGRKPGA